jgi:Nucleoside-diphosphate-sugar epimerases
MGKIIIFGATGSVGPYTAIRLKELGYDVIAVGKRHSDNGFFKDYDIDYYSLDISNKDDFQKLPKCGISQIINFAGAMPAHMRIYDPYQYIETIIKGTLNILEYMRKIGINKIIFAQSIADILYLFGSKEPIEADVERRFPLTGDHSVYSISKNTAVNLIEHYHYQYGFKRFVLRLPTIYLYHPDQYYYVDGVKKILGYRLLINKAIKGEPIDIWGDPKSAKELVYVKDFVQLVEKCVATNIDGGIYNVGTGIGVTMEDQVKGMIKVFSPKYKQSEIRYKPEMKSSPQFILDISKSIKELGYKPIYNYLKYFEDFKNEMLREPFAKLWGYKNNF